MKKVITTLVLASMMVVPSSALSVMVNGSPLQSDVPPQIVNDRTMLPARAIAESLESKVDWDAKKSAVTITNATTKIEIKINNKMAKVNDKYVELDVPAKIINGRTMLPASFVANNMGWNVDWDDATKTVSIKGGEAVKEGEEKTEEIKVQERKTEEMRREEKREEDKKEQDKREQEKKEEMGKEKVEKEEAKKADTEKVEIKKEEAEKGKKSKSTNSNKPRLAPLPSPKIDIGK